MDNTKLLLIKDILVQEQKICDLKKIIVTHVIMIFDFMYLHGMKVGKLLDDLIQMIYNCWALSPSFFSTNLPFE